ncbi:hypothetical protein XA68_18193 [Ophiocordyceps unilateralis]|uniref:Uncharacterized protein n=1 Tax=Ophiocordyceps unilateralis TaxID=268505 RepID=A0A2A9P3N5_OPHUN|nr:hypothetical protein XA68_18193 [Ophiocordyceps unilateralis]
MWSRRDSWPPTQVRLNPSMMKACSDPRPLLEDIDDNPLTYFLTPSPGGDLDTFGDDDMDFDAGIEDATHPRTIVRSVSPSSLEGLRKSQASASSPDLDSDVPSTDDDDDDDDCGRFSPPRSVTFRFAPLRNLAIDGLRLRARSPPVSGNGLLSSASYPGLPRGKADAAVRAQRGGRPSRSAQVRPRPTRRLWREPSPDVWSIEEETEEEVLKSETADGQKEGPAVEQKSAKPKKRVRFLLPARE